MTLSRVMCVITTIFLMVRYSVLALCIQRTNERRGSRQLTSFSLAIGFRGPNLLRAAVTGERPETLPSAKVSKWRKSAKDTGLVGPLPIQSRPSKGLELAGMRAGQPNGAQPVKTSVQRY
jgi:hypothetical protein